jgi:hypothetical protein
MPGTRIGHESFPNVKVSELDKSDVSSRNGTHLTVPAPGTSDDYEYPGVVERGLFDGN